MRKQYVPIPSHFKDELREQPLGVNLAMLSGQQQLPPGWREGFAGRRLAALAGDLCSVPTQVWSSQPPLISAPGNTAPSSGFFKHFRAYSHTNQNTMLSFRILLRGTTSSYLSELSLCFSAPSPLNLNLPMPFNISLTTCLL